MGSWSNIFDGGKILKRVQDDIYTLRGHVVLPSENPLSAKEKSNLGWKDQPTLILQKQYQIVSLINISKGLTKC